MSHHHHEQASMHQRQAGHWNAYANASVDVPPSGSGALTGMTFAVKDVFDIKGHTSGAGNPDWLRTHEPASNHAHAVSKLLAAGAHLQGTTITDELMYSINGENAHYGTPINPKAPGRIPGGSSSGSAVAASAGLVDFAIGTDTGGSIRVPSAYCGIYGVRPTHGAVDAEGLVPLAPSFDTIGWMARDAQTLLRVGRVLLDQSVTEGDMIIGNESFKKLLVPTDLWAIPERSSMEVLQSFIPGIESLIGGSLQAVVAAPEGLGEWAGAFRTLQGLEIWRSHREWIARERPVFGPGIAERFVWASTLREEHAIEALLIQERARERIEAFLGKDGVLMMPTVPAAAPLLGQSGEEVERVRKRTFELCCVAGLSGLPQVTIPIMGKDGLPIGLSFMAGRNQDARLLAWVANQADDIIHSIGERAN
ncbi:amidase [Paenibacillus harenae]|uniref:amidase n=1 Tax=Paenibacillus harenae TaxID=306543 RepID=UPI00278E9456|nr:amidase [Paenibacillus harenae]MDQ0061845.1 amidase [Paenibacillus harenae]